MVTFEHENEQLLTELHSLRGELDAAIKVNLTGNIDRNATLETNESIPVQKEEVKQLIEEKNHQMI